MKIKQMFREDIDRNIRGVIAVNDREPEAIAQELREYVVTKEICGKLNDFYESYIPTVDGAKTKDVGVWISGFYGSGKSHFLTILSYLLTNETVLGKKAIEYFRPKFSPMDFAMTIEKAGNIPTEAILFDIAGVKVGKEETFTSVIAKQFFGHLGYAERNLKAAKLEMYLEREGKLETFKMAFAEEMGGFQWEQAHNDMAFYQDGIVTALTKVGWSQSAAENWFNGSETEEISIDELTDEIQKYVQTKEKNFHLLFLIDEVVQYIGESVSLMLDLQTLVEELGSKCQGQVWVIVTGQEDVDHFAKVVRGDFSKIQGRFKTRLTLSSSSVDEVISERLLAKTEAARALLKQEYNDKATILRNLFTFTKDTVKDIQGYESDEEFARLYPLVPYQLKLEQNALTKTRTSGLLGKSHSDGARSMLPSCQNAVQSVEDEEETALVPFCAYFDSMYKDLVGDIQRVFDRAMEASGKNLGLEPYDVEILKVLFLLKNIDDVKSNLENITVLMIDDINVDKIQLRTKVQSSLDRLVHENYVSRNGETYSFLTNDEQEIAKQIQSTEVDPMKVRQSIGSILFGDIYPSKKFSYQENGSVTDFAFDKYVDDLPFMNGNGIQLRFLTKGSDLYEQGQEEWILQSNSQDAVFVILESSTKYLDSLMEACQIDAYIQAYSQKQMSENIRRILTEKKSLATSEKRECKALLEEAIRTARFIIDGREEFPNGLSAKDKIDEAMRILIGGVYHELGLVRYHYRDDGEVLSVFKEEALGNHVVSNPDAVQKVSDYLKSQAILKSSVSMEDVQKRFQSKPFGWQEIDIAACIAELLYAQEIQIRYNGNPISTTDSKIVDYLRRKNLVANVRVERRVRVDEHLLAMGRRFARDMFDVKVDIPTKEDEFLLFLKECLEKERDEIQAFLVRYQNRPYPGRKILEQAKTDFEDLLTKSKDLTAVLTEIKEKGNNLLDEKEDMDDIKNFFASQVDSFDKALKLLEETKDEKDFLSDEARTALDSISSILGKNRPYRDIPQLMANEDIVKKCYQEILESKKEEGRKEIADDIEALNAYACMTRQITIEDYQHRFQTLLYEMENITKISTLEVKKARIPLLLEQAKTAILSILEEQIEDSVKENISQSIVLEKKNLFSEATFHDEKDVEDYLETVRKKILDEIRKGKTIHII